MNQATVSRQSVTLGICWSKQCAKTSVYGFGTHEFWKGFAMKKKINLHFMLLTALAILATLVLTLAISYDMLKQQIIEEIRSYAYLIADISENENISWSNFDSIEDELRITIVQSDGKVIYDNCANTAQMENHAARKEIQEALEKGEGQAVRNSDTMSENLFYCAVRMEDGCVVRVSKQASSVWGVLIRLIPVMVCIVAVLFILCAVLSKFITNRMIAPIENVANHMNDLESVEIYEELRPFVATIQKQHEDIMKSANMRQEFTANVSHELKTPLTSISGYAELMENNLVDADNIANFARAIHQNADRLLTLINDIIRLSELDAVQAAPEFEELDLYAVAQNCVQLLQVNAQNHGVSIRAKGSSQMIHANRQMLEELVYNLCDNAIRYNKQGGMVEVSVSRTRNGILLSVQDNGIGIPKEHQERIFERFYRVDKSRSKETGGTGLGLAIVKHIAQVHDASLEVISEVNVGTNIQVTFRH